MTRLSREWFAHSMGSLRVVLRLTLASALVVGTAWAAPAEDRSLPGLPAQARVLSSRIENDVLIREFSADDVSAASVAVDGVSGANLGLLNGRFSVSVTYRTPSNQSGSGMVVPGVSSPDSGLFYFFGEKNWEILVKAVDLCGLPGTDFYTVIAAAATDVEFRLVVTDTVAGVTRTYENPLGTKPVAVRDSFATCGSAPPPPAGCPTNGPLTDLAARDCQQYAYIYRLGDIASAMSSDSQLTVICTTSLGDSDVICQGGPVQSATTFRLTTAFLNGGPGVPLGAGSGGNISSNGRVLNYTAIVSGQRFDFNGMNWVQTRPVDAASETSASEKGESTAEVRVLGAIRQALSKRSAVNQNSADPASRELAAVLSVQSESTH